MKLPPLWPTLIFVLLGGLVTLQLTFVAIAFVERDEISPSYQTGDR